MPTKGYILYGYSNNYTRQLNLGKREEEGPMQLRRGAPLGEVPLAAMGDGFREHGVLGCRVGL